MAFISRSKRRDGPLVLDAALDQHLQGDHAVQFGVQCLVDRAHAAATEFLQELVFAKLTRDGKRALAALGRPAVCLAGPAGHRLGAGQGDAALGFGEQRVVGNRGAEPGNQRIRWRR